MDSDKMLVKFEQGIKPTIEQFREIAESILDPTNTNLLNLQPDRQKVYPVRDYLLYGEFADYYYRVNLPWKTVTILDLYPVSKEDVKK